MLSEITFSRIRNLTKKPKLLADGKPIIYIKLLRAKALTW